MVVWAGAVAQWKRCWIGDNERTAAQQAAQHCHMQARGKRTKTGDRREARKDKRTRAEQEARGSKPGKRKVE